DWSSDVCSSDLFKSRLEFFIRLFKSRFRVNMNKTAIIDKCKKQITVFFLYGLLVATGMQLLLKLLHLFRHFSPNLLRPFPLKTKLSSFLLHSVGLNQRRQRIRHAPQHRLFTFLQLYALPVLLDLLRTFQLQISINMRMPLYQFLTN